MNSMNINRKFSITLLAAWVVVQGAGPAATASVAIVKDGKPEAVIYVPASVMQSDSTASLTGPARPASQPAALSGATRQRRPPERHC